MSSVTLACGAEQHLRGAGALHAQYTVATIAHHLAQINRFAGAARRPYSVAEHSLLCAELAEDAGHPPIVQLCCLMHDAHECVVGDVCTPVKRLLGDAWTALAAQHARTLRARFGLQGAFVVHRLAIRAIDLQALATERRDLLAWCSATSSRWPELDTPGAQVPSAHTDLTRAWRTQRDWSEWRDAFIERFEHLQRAVHAASRALASHSRTDTTTHDPIEPTHALRHHPI